LYCIPHYRELNVKHIDLWILDTEGAEESVLKGTDFTKVGGFDVCAFLNAGFSFILSK
jgi:hypothetical protein